MIDNFEQNKILHLMTGKPVAIFGNGITGKVVKKFLDNKGIKSICYDESPEIGQRKAFTENTADDHNLVIYSPGFLDNHSWRKTAKSVGLKSISELDLASIFFKGKIIAVTGTNGKSSLTLFLNHALNIAGIKSVAAGNVGIPMINFCNEDDTRNLTAVCEVSSFQAESLKYLNPNAVLWTNFEDDHLECHQTLKSYFQAKWNLVDRLNSNPLITTQSVLNNATNFKLEFPDNLETISTNDPITNNQICQSPLVKAPQKENLLIALKYWKKINLPMHFFIKAVQTFKIPKHRLNFVTDYKGIKFWNDSKATNFSAAIAAIKSFKHPLVWIGGGKSKEGNLEFFANEITKSIKSAFLIGETAKDLAEIIKSINKSIEIKILNNLPDAVLSAYGSAVTGDNVLLSPGFSSLDMFSSFGARGECFIKTIQNFKN